VKLEFLRPLYERIGDYVSEVVGHDLAVSREDLLERDVPGPVTDRADAAMVRAVAATDAELHFLPASQAEAGQVGTVSSAPEPSASVRPSTESSSPASMRS